METDRYAFSDAALKSLERLTEDERERILTRVGMLAEEFTPVGSRKVMGVSDGGNPVRRIRVGNYRVLYSGASDQQIHILDIGHRKDVYKNLNRRR